MSASPDMTAPHPVALGASPAAGPTASVPARSNGKRPSWRTPLLWRALLLLALIWIPMACRLRVTGQMPRKLRRGPLILAANHIATFDPVAFTAAAARRLLAPRMMAAAGLFNVPLVGAIMRGCGHIPVYRNDERVANAVPDALAALREGSVVCVFPEGRIGLDPAMWPERPKSGVARLALRTRVPVIPVAIWGTHEVLPYHGFLAMVLRLAMSFWRRPVVRVHFGDPVDLADLSEGVVGDTQRAGDRIMAAIVADLAKLRADEPRLPRYRDPTRPVSSARLGRPR